MMGWIALISVAVTFLIMLYALFFATLFIRKLIAPEIPSPTLGIGFHKLFWSMIGVLVACAFVLFVATLWPILLALSVGYLGFKFVIPVARKILFS